MIAVSFPRGIGRRCYIHVIMKSSMIFEEWEEIVQSPISNTTVIRVIVRFDFDLDLDLQLSFR